MILNKSFVTNKHILIQFDKNKIPVRDEVGCVKDAKNTGNTPQTVILEANGMIVTQSKEAQHYLDAEIVGESELVDGRKFIVTRIEDGDCSRVVCLQFTLDGRAKIVKIIPDVMKQLKEALD